MNVEVGNTAEKSDTRACAMRRMIILWVLYLLRTKYALSEIYFKQNYLIYFICSNVTFEISASYLVELDYSNKYIDNILMI